MGLTAAGVVRLAVLPLAGTSPRAKESIRRAAAWLHDVSLGRCELDIRWLPAAAAERPVSEYAILGGKGRWPRNSQGLIASLIQNGALPSDLSPEAALLAVASTNFLPHAWHLPSTTRASSGPRPYAVVPENATFGTVAHELGHLLFGWPDMQWNHCFDRECLMARGASGAQGENPSPPSAPLLLKMGWLESLPVTPDLCVAALENCAGALDWLDSKFVVEFRRDGDGDSRLLLYATPAGQPIELIARLPLSENDLRCSVLGLLAPHLRRI